MDNVRDLFEIDFVNYEVADYSIHFVSPKQFHPIKES